MLACIFESSFSCSIVHFNEKCIVFLLSPLLKVGEQRMTLDLWLGRQLETGFCFVLFCFQFEYVLFQDNIWIDVLI